MKIYTKKGDKGQTSLIGGKKVRKDHVRINAYGTIDELNSFTGLVRDVNHDRSIKDLLAEIQNNLFNIGSHLASAPDSKMQLPELKDNAITRLEEAMDQMDAELPELKNFILPGGHVEVSYCHLARTVCRRAERNVVALFDQEASDERILVYLNRLSDYFFVLGRKMAQERNTDEVIWKP